MRGMEQLRAYLNSLPPPERDGFAARCGTTVGYLRKALSARQRLGEGLCIAIERESGGSVLLESLRPDVDWGYLAARRGAATSTQHPEVARGAA